MYQLIHLLAQRIVLLREAFGKVLLVYDFLRRLVTVECEAATGTLYDDVGTQATENARLVVLGWIEAGNHDVIWIVERCSTCWTRSIRV
jgi:hypothetical protein